MDDAEQIPIPRGGPDLQQCAHANLRRAQRVVSQVYDAALKPCGLRATQFTLLAVIAVRGEMPLSRLAQVLAMDRTTLTRNLGPLRAQGWASIGREEDQRVRLVGITAAGRDVLARATPLWREAQSDVLRGLGSVRLSRLIKELNAMTDSLLNR